MSNQYVLLPTPLGNGTGTPVDVSTFGALKSIVVTGDAKSTKNIEINNDAAQAGTWQSVVTFQKNGTVTLSVAARWMRVRVSGYNVNVGGTNQVNVGGTDQGTFFTALPVTVGTGAGAAVDVSGIDGAFITVQVGDSFQGSTIIEVSEDGSTEWGQALSFQTPGAQSLIIIAHFMRVRRVGVPVNNPGLPVVNIGFTSAAEGGGGGGGGVDLEDEGTPVTGNPHSTLNFVGAGVTVTDVAGVGTITVPGASSGIALQDEGTPVTGNPHSTVNFVGAGVAVTDVAGVGTVTVAGGIALQDESTPVTGNPHATVNFVGTGVTVTDVGGVGTVTIPGASGGIVIQEEGTPIAGNPHSTVNFVGAGVTATDVAGVGTVTVPGGIALQDEGTPVTGNPHATVNFVGAGVTATDVAGVGTVTVPGGIALQDEGTPVTGNPHGTVNFVGSGVTVTDVAGVGTVTIPGGGGIALQDEGTPVTGNPHSTVNFVGAGVAVTDVAGVGTVTIPGGGTVPGQLRIGGILTPGATGGTQLDNYNPTGFANACWIRIDVNFLTTFTGIIAQPDGTVIWITNIGVNQLAYVHESTDSTAANRFLLPGGVNWFLPPNCSYQMIYDATSVRWRVLGMATQSWPVISATNGPSLWIGNPNNNIGFGSVLGNVSTFRSGEQLEVGNGITTAFGDFVTNGTGFALRVLNNFELAQVGSPTLSGDVNNWTAFGTSNNVVRVDQTTPGFQVTGLSDGASGMVRTIVNISAFPLTLVNASASSSAANRFALPAATAVIPANGSFQVWYDAISLLWRPFN